MTGVPAAGLDLEAAQALCDYIALEVVGGQYAPPEVIKARTGQLLSIATEALAALQRVRDKCDEMEATNVGLLFAWAHEIRAAVRPASTTEEQT